MNLTHIKEKTREEFKEYLAKHDEGYSIDFVPSLIVQQTALAVLDMVREKVSTVKDLNETVLKSEDWKEGGRYFAETLLSRLQAFRAEIEGKGCKGCAYETVSGELTEKHTCHTEGKKVCCEKCEKRVRDRSFIGSGSSRRSMTDVHLECKNKNCPCHLEGKPESV